ncbi:MAG: creatininase family protein [Candidatus Heimdallarchaeota archaeon]
MQTIRTEEMAWPDIKHAIDKGFNKVIFCIGSIEQHGPHLPEYTDSFWGDEVANRIAIKLGNTLQAPTIKVGNSAHHLDFPGTISLKPSTLKAVIRDYVESLVRHGFTKILLFPSHGGNFRITEEIITELTPLYPGVRIWGYTDLNRLLDLLAEFSANFGVTKAESGGHAGESETSMMLCLTEEFIVKERMDPGYIGSLGDKEIALIFDHGMKELTENGILGDPTKASADAGEFYIQRLADLLVDEISKII